MNTFEVSIYPELSALGGFRVLEGTLALASYEVGGQQFALDDGISYELKLTNTGEAVLLEGVVRAHATSSCARCLEPARVYIEGEAQGYYLHEHVDEVEGMEPDEYDFVDEAGNIDVGASILAALVHATPFVVLCREDCRGLCPICGQNRNVAPCTCQEGGERQSPFSALSHLLTEDEEV